MTNPSVFCWILDYCWFSPSQYMQYIPSWELSHILFPATVFESMIFPLLFGGICDTSLEGNFEMIIIFVQMLQKIHCSYLLIAKYSYLEDEKNLWRMIFVDVQSHSIWAPPMLEESNHQKQIQVESDLLIFLSGSPTALCNLVKFHRDLTRPKIPKGSFWKGNSPYFWEI